VTCTDQSSGASTTQTEWIPDQSIATAPAVDPRSLALQAERSLIKIVADDVEPFDSVHPSTMDLYRSLTRRRSLAAGRR
jgi:hypothetical protein